MCHAKCYILVLLWTLSRCNANPKKTKNTKPNFFQKLKKQRWVRFLALFCYALLLFHRTNHSRNVTLLQCAKQKKMSLSADASTRRMTTIHRFIRLLTFLNGAAALQETVKERPKLYWRIIRRNSSLSLQYYFLYIHQCHVLRRRLVPSHSGF